MVFKVNWLLMPCLGVPYKWDKRIWLFLQLSWLKSSVWRRRSFGFKHSGNSHGTSAVKQDNITCFLITKIKLMPWGNFAKCTIYLNATFRLSLDIQKLPASARNKKAISKLKIILYLNQKWHRQIEKLWGKRFASKCIILWAKTLQAWTLKLSRHLGNVNSFDCL